jgi:hypothetical protein
LCKSLDAGFRRHDLQTIAVLALFISACASDFPVRPPEPVRDPAVPVVREGFSVLPPGSDWIVSLPTAGIASFEQAGATATQVWSVSVLLMDLGREFSDAAQMAAFTREQRAREINPHRYLMLRHTEAPDPAAGPLCVRHALAARDFSSRAASGQPLVLVSEGVTCAHPQAPGFAVEAGYAQLSPDEKMPAPLRDAGERLIRSLSYLPVKRPSSPNPSHAERR